MNDTYDYPYTKMPPQVQHVQPVNPPQYKAEAVVEVDAQWWAEWVHAYSVAFILPIVLAWFAWRTVKTKQQAHNRERLRKYIEQDREDDYREDTVMQYVKKKINSEETTFSE